MSIREKVNEQIARMAGSPLYVAWTNFLRERPVARPYERQAFEAGFHAGVEFGTTLERAPERPERQVNLSKFDKIIDWT
jgi:hypothetical protein